MSIRHSRAVVLRVRQLATTTTTSNSKVLSSADEALDKVPSWKNITVAVGGFGLGGTPETLLNALTRRNNNHHNNVSNITIASLTGGLNGVGMGLLLEQPGKVKRIMSSYVGENPTLEQAFLKDGTLEVELIPQGTLAQRLQAAGAGIPAFYTPTGAGTIYAHGGIPIRYKKSNHENDNNSMIPDLVSEARETRMFGTTEYVLEYALPTDVALVKCYKADTRGNLVFRGTAQNANPDAAMSAKITIAEAEHIVDAGDLDPNEVHLPGIYVHHVIHATDNTKPIERLRLSNPKEEKQEGSGGAKRNTTTTTNVVKGPRGRIMRRTAKEFKNGMYVNLGIGMPTLASNYIPPDIKIELQAENGLMGIGPFPSNEVDADADYINAGKETITALPGASTFSSSNSFNMIRGGHIDLTILGGLQCSASGDLASWIVPGKLIKGMGGAMDLVGAPGSRVVVTMDHTAKDGSPKLLQECTLPLTGHKVVDRIITDMGVFDIDKKQDTSSTTGTAPMTITLVEIAPGITVDDVRAATGCDFNTVPEPIPLMDDHIEE